MEHLGDITKINGAEIPQVDVIIGGSPCQDFSKAGQRKGLSGERSGLYMEQVRVIKEMRKKDAEIGRTEDKIRPRFQVWENVPGALSSSKGEDFRTVLEETAKIAGETAIIPKPPKGKWRNSGCILGRGWSIAWRIFDAQFWGVPQRRRRIALVADFGGHSAPEILFEHDSMLGDSSPGRKEEKETAAPSGNSPALANSCRYILPINDRATRGGKSAEYTNCFGIGKPGDPSPSLTTASRHAVFDCRGFGNGYAAATLIGNHDRRVTDYTNVICTVSGKYPPTYTVRRFTPLECERLQGFPDGWTDIPDYTNGKGRKQKTSDTARYAAIGNSIALPPWRWVLSKIAKQYKTKAPTMGSLFDGIGGFPLIWESINGENTCLWASEIEPFPIAVTQKHFASYEAKNEKGANKDD